MAQIYLTGALSEAQDPFEWMDSIEEEYPEHTFVNPYLLNDFDIGSGEVYENPSAVIDPAEEAIEESDALLCRWDDGVFLAGSAMEVKHASDNGIPVVIWYEGSKENPALWITGKSRAHFTDRDKALKVLLGYVEGSSAFTFSL